MTKETLNSIGFPKPQETVHPIFCFGQVLGYPLILQSTLGIREFLGDKNCHPDPKIHLVLYSIYVNGVYVIKTEKKKKNL